jgi:7,8-dihydropterin-6-yl-methyl-4-(beta-D-ribofuranosyl)aminobenzene 5'-phosphate synthase
MHQADSVEIVIAVDNWIDILLAEHRNEGVSHGVARRGLIHHFTPRETPFQAEFGLSVLVRAHHDSHSSTVLFDSGLTGDVLAHNLEALDVQAADLDHVVISHGHPDHYGGLFRLLESRTEALPVATHPDAFLPRYLVTGDGRVSHFYNHAFSQDSLARSGASLVLTREAVELGCGIRTTGEIPRITEFEGPRPPERPRGPGLYQVSPEGAFRLDEVWDEQGLIIDVKSEGLIVLTGCAHAGVVNTILRARELCGERPIRAVLGGFHLGFPTTPRENIGKTVEALHDLSVQVVMPMHCSGLGANAEFAGAMPAEYVQPSIGTTLTIGG